MARIRRIEARVREAAQHFGLDPDHEHAWLLEAETYLETRRRTDGLTGLCSYVRTMMGMRRKREPALSCRLLQEYHAWLMKHGGKVPRDQAVPATRAHMRRLHEALPWGEFVAYLLAWRTASRMSETIGLKGANLLFRKDRPGHVFIMWMMLTKYANKTGNPMAVRNTTHLVLDLDSPVDGRLWEHLRALGPAESVSLYRTYSQAYATLRFRLPSDLLEVGLTATPSSEGPATRWRSCGGSTRRSGHFQLGCQRY